MAAWGYEFYLRVLKVSLTRSLRSLVRALEDNIRIPARPCNILYVCYEPLFIVPLPTPILSPNSVFE